VGEIFEQLRCDGCAKLLGEFVPAPGCAFRGYCRRCQRTTTIVVAAVDPGLLRDVRTMLGLVERLAGVREPTGTLPLSR
jgi:hypothetical protein